MVDSCLPKQRTSLYYPAELVNDPAEDCHTIKINKLINTFTEPLYFTYADTKALLHDPRNHQFM